MDRKTSSRDSSKALRLRCPLNAPPSQLAQHSGTERPSSTAAATSVWKPRMSTQSKATSRGFFRPRTSRRTTPRMACEGSTLSLAQKRQHRLIWCLAEPPAKPGIARPRLPSDTRLVRMAAETRVPRVLAWESLR
jgi:hypothetical protein